ncbi:MAG: hypothetical protein R2789_19025 [Microthrixaceae bacterium]
MTAPGCSKRPILERSGYRAMLDANVESGDSRRGRGPSREPPGEGWSAWPTSSAPVAEFAGVGLLVADTDQLPDGDDPSDTGWFS